ncbi:MAG: hypothetical protein IJW48_00570 [Clostridia bacterium]|nr:hypothetical protein [Clostridia bacterium]
MIEKYINVDFSHRCGRVKPLTGLSGGPVFDREGRLDFTEEYKELAAPAIRIADSECGEWGFLDIHNVFPDFSLDETMPLSYNFTAADKLVLLAKETGAEIYLRLGESPEPYEVKLHTRPPRDREKWARICERIVAHYNRGFAAGYKLGIKYVEIMSSPDGDCFFGEKEEYFELYRAAAERLKACFPRLKVGAYSSGGFKSLNRVDVTERERSYVAFLEDFLDFVSKNGVPLDFFSWKCFAETPEELALHTRYAASYLNHAGQKRAESIISEFNLSGTPFDSRKYPALLAASVITALKSDVSMMFYSGTHPYSEKNALYTLDDGVTKRKYAAFSVMRSLGKLLGRGFSVVDTGEDYRHELYTLATSNGERGYVILVTGEFDGRVELTADGQTFSSYSIEGTLGGGERGAGFSTSATELPFDGRIVLRTGKYEVYFISLRS